ncbi:Ktr system potassium transporter B [Idiomarina tyrosinivorans]|uniref:Ktr system potassium transporter B n=1 Tax=Idiomarina tyrosinivorans TaxID=1445662 RepID=A0A432ZTC3_9GAMM|nr:TrkH family potassium uptake protein [Idiomarina tyrosinivorans]RUO81102.1 Ktr system potassium transporter B [Idiomarina tyrosinivorans]
MRQWIPGFHLFRRHPRTSHRVINASPPFVLAGGFALLIALGACLLKLPFATTSPISWFESFFTATSAVTVTGLIVVDTATQFSHWGQLIIAGLIQLGGLGFMTFAVVAALSLGGRISVREQIVAQEALHQTNMSKVGSTAKAVLLIAVTVELIGIILLTLVWWPQQGFADAAFNALFHTISAFNNAGFALWSDSLMGYVGSVPVVLLITALFIIGGLGFGVLVNIYDERRWQRMAVYTKIILLATLLINLIAFAVYWWLEKDNPATLGHLTLGDQALAAWFQAVTPRTAGFNTVDTGALTHGSAVFTLLLMFIGAGSMSTGGGIKLGTFIVLWAATRAFLRRYERVTIMRRTVAQSLVMKSLAVALISLALLFSAIFLMVANDDLPFLDIVFEAVSAFGTVGLSRGITSDLSTFSQSVIMLLMFVGRVGPITLAYFLATPKKGFIRYPETDVQVG